MSRVRSFAAVVILSAVVSPTAAPPPLPRPFMTIPATGGDSRLAVFSISPDGRLLALGWDSGRIALWSLEAGERVLEFASDLGAPRALGFDAPASQLFGAGTEGRLASFEIPSGKRLRAWTADPGTRGDGIRELLVDPEGRWLAYANGDTSQVIDLTTDVPTRLADLGGAASLALSRDGYELWTADRKSLASFRTSDWKETGRWPLKAKPIAASPVVVQTGVDPEGRQAVAAASEKGLVLYRMPDMSGDFVTGTPSSSVAFASATGYVNLSGETLAFLTAEGSLRCERSIGPRNGYAVSEDGQWLALSHPDRVDLWRMTDLLGDCQAPGGSSLGLPPPHPGEPQALSATAGKGRYHLLPNLPQYFRSRYGKDVQVTSTLKETPDGPLGTITVHGHLTLESPAGATREARARSSTLAFLKREAGLLDIRNDSEVREKELRFHSPNREDGAVHYDRVLNGIPVTYNYFSFGLDPHGLIDHFNAALVPVSAELDAAVRHEKIAGTAANATAQRDLEALGLSKSVVTYEPALVAYFRSLLVIWEIRGHFLKEDPFGFDVYYGVDAITGEIVRRNCAMRAVEATTPMVEPNPSPCDAMPPKGSTMLPSPYYFDPYYRATPP